jgi:hypothetical protein
MLVPAVFAVTVTALSLPSTPASAKGCLKGAVIGVSPGTLAVITGCLGPVRAA